MVASPCQPNWILIDVAADVGVVVSVPVVVEAGVLVLVLPWQPDALVDALRVVLLLDVAPRIKPCRPDDLVALIRQCQWRAQMIAVIAGKSGSDQN